MSRYRKNNMTHAKFCMLVNGICFGSHMSAVVNTIYAISYRHIYFFLRKQYGLIW